MDWFPEFVLKYLSFEGKCFRHCDKPTTMQVFSQDASRLVGAYVCPDGFVSQVVYFSTTPDLKWFEDMISKQVGSENFASRDVRVGARHGWELEGDARHLLETKLGTDGSITEAYWTRYPKTDAQKQVAISLCNGEGARKGRPHLFAHDRTNSDKLCHECGPGQ
jgi:hypothetical protein